MTPEERAAVATLLSELAQITAKHSEPWGSFAQYAQIWVREVHDSAVQAETARCAGIARNKSPHVIVNGKRERVINGAAFCIEIADAIERPTHGEE